jgi:hypothetical protein
MGSSITQFHDVSQTIGDTFMYIILAAVSGLLVAVIAVCCRRIYRFEKAMREHGAREVED